MHIYPTKAYIRTKKNEIKCRFGEIRNSAWILDSLEVIDLMPDAELNERDRLALAVAHLLTQDRKQKEIENLLKISSQSEVSRLVTHARNMGWLRTSVEWPAGVVDSEKEEIKNRGFGNKEQLERKINDIAIARGGVPVKTLHIVYSGSDLSNEERLMRFGIAAADVIVPLAANAKTCAVAWGKTVKSLIDAIRNRDCSTVENLVGLPISGEPFNNTDTGTSPSAAARYLCEAFGSNNWLSLQGVPARIPKELSKDANTIRRFLKKCDDYKDIFYEKEGRGPFMKDVGMIISGIGDVITSENDPWYRETAEMEDQGEGDLMKITIGNIGGVWIPKDSDNPEQEKKISAINERWLGIQKVHFESCAKRCNAGEASGVVVIAVEEAKAHILHRVIGMVNHLIISQPLAQALLDIPDHE